MTKYCSKICAICGSHFNVKKTIEIDTRVKLTSKTAEHRIGTIFYELFLREEQLSHTDYRLST